MPTLSPAYDQTDCDGLDWIAPSDTGVKGATLGKFFYIFLQNPAFCALFAQKDRTSVPNIGNIVHRELTKGSKLGSIKPPPWFKGL